MPVSRRIVVRAKGPHKVPPCDSLQDVRIASHVIWIVEIDKTVVERWRVENGGSDGKQDCKKKDKDTFRWKARAERGGIRCDLGSRVSAAVVGLNLVGGEDHGGSLCGLPRGDSRAGHGHDDRKISSRQTASPRDVKKYHGCAAVLLQAAPSDV